MTSRRNFIKVGGLAGGGLAISLVMPKYASTMAFKRNEREITMNNFLTIDTSGNITAILTKHEMGQGTGTSVPTILADELGADWSKVKIKRSDYNPVYSWREMGTTGGSGSIERIWNAIRNAGATAREMMKQAAAQRWGVDTMVVKAENSFVINIVTKAKLEFGELAEAASKLPVPEKVVLKKPKDYVYIGTSVKNRITPEVIAGKANYGIDMDIPGMVYAAIKRCPVFEGKVVTYDDTEARGIEGVLDIFPLTLSEDVKKTMHPKVGYVDEGVVVVADSTWTAFKATKLLKVTWDTGANGSRSTISLENEMKAAKDAVTFKFEMGDFEKVSNDRNNEILEVEYNNPHHPHALMEPINATAHFKGETCEVWVGTQDAAQTNAEVAKLLSLPRENVTVHVLNSGGSFGRRYHMDSSIEAAFISRKINKPVKVTWTREDEMMHDHFQHCLRNYLTAVITPDKTVAGVQNKAICTVDYAIWSEKWDHYYAFPNIRGYRAHIPTLVQQGAWRSVGEHSGSLGKECFIDELAHKTGKDPIDYRIELLGNEVDWGDPKDFPSWVINYFLPRKKIIRQRYLDTLEYIRTNNLWNKEMPQETGKGFAIANFGDTICAQIAEVRIDDSECGFSVDKVTAVVYCGMVVNPHFGRGQIEGAIVWALSAVKYGGIAVENGIVQRTNFDNNKVVRMDETPEIEVIFMESDEEPSGLGEPGTPALAPAVLNAIFDASGKRIREIPVRKEVFQSV